MKRVAILAVALFLPITTSAETERFVFTTDAQSIATDAASAQITLRSQDAAGASAPVTSTTCLQLISSAATGQFSSSATNWSPVTVLTMSKNTASRSFYYKDTASGNRTLTVKVATKPDSESKACTAWPIEEWSVQWTATHTITIGDGGQNTGEEEDETISSDTATTTPKTQTISTTSTYVAPPATPLFADGGDDRTVIVGADTDFYGRAYNRKQEIVDNVRFAWNFGDGTTAEGAAISHHYEYPGRYAVVLTIAQDHSAASDFIVVTAEPAKLGFNVHPDGSILIENHAGRDLNLSNWQIRSFSRVFTVPADTVILKGATLRLSAKLFDFPVGPQTELLYPNGLKAMLAGAQSETIAAPSNSSIVAQDTVKAKTPVPVAKKKTTTEKQPVSKSTEIESATGSAVVAEQTSDQVAGAATASGNMYWWLSAVGFAGLAFAGAATAKRYRKQEWKVIEQSDEGDTP